MQLRRPESLEAARHHSAQLDQRLGLDDPVAQERDEIGAPCERDRAVSELGERRTRADRRPVHPTRHDAAHVHERFRVDEPRPEQRDELGPAGERPRAVPERCLGGLERLRLD